VIIARDALGLSGSEAVGFLLRDSITRLSNRLRRLLHYVPPLRVTGCDLNHAEGSQQLVFRPKEGIMGETPSKRRRRAREAYDPNCDPMEVYPYKKGTYAYIENMVDWLDGWAEA
jgi:hypothetical protein